MRPGQPACYKEIFKIEQAPTQPRTYLAGSTPARPAPVAPPPAGADAVNAAGHAPAGPRPRGAGATPAAPRSSRISPRRPSRSPPHRRHVPPRRCRQPREALRSPPHRRQRAASRAASQAAASYHRTDHGQESRGRRPRHARPATGQDRHEVHPRAVRAGARAAGRSARRGPTTGRRTAQPSG